MQTFQTCRETNITPNTRGAKMMTERKEEDLGGAQRTRLLALMDRVDALSEAQIALEEREYAHPDLIMATSRASDG